MNRKRRPQNFSGFGLVRTKTYVVTRKPKIPFEKIKQIYGDELERFISKKGTTEKKIQFSKEESKKIKRKVASIIKKQKREYYFKVFVIYLVVITSIILSYFILQ
tara:strand:- start:32515 stop:32829 length:315 start_codon:yes stop_codon:yes gene_type:complete